MALRVALFVEGSENRAIRRGPLLVKMWTQLADALGIEGFSRVEPISKKHLVAMDPGLPTMSGAGEALDQLMARCLEREPFDAAVVAWDLVPPKDADAGFCVGGRPWSSIASSPNPLRCPNLGVPPRHGAITRWRAERYPASAASLIERLPMSSLRCAWTRCSRRCSFRASNTSSEPSSLLIARRVGLLEVGAPRRFDSSTGRCCCR